MSIDHFRIPTTVTFEQLERRISDIFVMAKYGHWTYYQIAECLHERVDKPLAERSAAGNPRHSKFVRGFAYGVKRAGYQNIERNELEFCYRDALGVLYSTRRGSTHKSTEDFYTRGVGSQLGNMECGHVWRDTGVSIDGWKYPNGAMCMWAPRPGLDLSKGV